MKNAFALWTAASSLLATASNMSLNRRADRDQREPLGNVPYGTNILKCTVPGKVALTFDDGPYIYTQELLNILASNNVKATFFVCGQYGSNPVINDQSSQYPAILRRMVAEGHQIGSHTFSHADLQVLLESNDMRSFEYQIGENERVISDVLGYYPTYFRPPYTSCGSNCMAQLGQLGYHVVSSIVVCPHEFKSTFIPFF